MEVPRFGKMAEPCHVRISVKRLYGWTYGMKSAQLVTERVCKLSYWKISKNFY